MTQDKWVFHKLLKTQFLIISISIALLFAQAVQAEYRPPGNQKPPRTNTDSSGTRFSNRTVTVLGYTSAAKYSKFQLGEVQKLLPFVSPHQGGMKSGCTSFKCKALYV